MKEDKGEIIMKRSVFAKIATLALALVLVLSLAACGKKSDSGVKILVPNDTTNEARALLLLQENGIITLKDGAGITATKNDIVDNPYNVEIVEAEAAQLPSLLADAEYAVINSNYAINAGLNPVKDSLAIEGSSSAYANILAVKEGNENSPKILALKAALESRQVASFIESKYNGSVVSTVTNPGNGYDDSVDYDALKGQTITVAASPTPHAEILEVAKEIYDRGVYVNPTLPPATPEGEALLRRQLEELLARMPVDRLLLPEIQDEYGVRDRLLALARELDIPVTMVTDTYQFPMGQAMLTVYPPVGAGDLNEQGLTFLCSAGDFDALITGDMAGNTEKKLVERFDLPDIEVLMVGHHGSRYSSSQELLQAVRPETAIISVGDNSYGHPTQEAMDRLSQAGAEIYRTDRQGNILVTVHGGD